VESAKQLTDLRESCCWPPAGKRGVGYSRANLFGKYFDSYSEEAQSPLLVAMIEHINAVVCLDDILSVEGLDAILIGPYDLSASLGLTGQFDAPEFTRTIEQIRILCSNKDIPCGLHVVTPDDADLKLRIKEGYRFIAYSLDSVFLCTSVEKPDLN